HVFYLDLGDRADLRLGDLSDLVLVRLSRSLFDAGFLTDEVGGGRALRDERVGAILEDRHHRGHDRAGERRGALVVFLYELAHVDAVRAERRADRRRCVRRSGVEFHFELSLAVLRHTGTSPTSPSLGSTARPASTSLSWTRVP